MKKNFILTLLSFFLFLTASAVPDAVLRGKVVDAGTGEALMGATVQVLQAGKTAVSDEDGNFSFSGLAPRNYTLTSSYLGYHRATLTFNPARIDTVLIVRMQENETSLGTAQVVGSVRRNTENAIVAAQKNSLVVQSGISAAQITKSQDKDASEVIRRVPGISIIDQKFVMVRGLSQRYNNVWINEAAVPSSEADSRAFSFDIIPSSQVDNLQIIKSPAPQYPADFTGGFIMIDTKEVPNENSARVSLSLSANDETHFQSFLSGKGSGTDWLGFDNMRSLKGGIQSNLAKYASSGNVNLLNNGFNNDWLVRSRKPWADFSLAADVNRSREFAGGAVFALLASLNYSNNYRTYSRMENNLFGAYDITHDCSTYFRKATDQQFSNNVRLGAMLNLTFVPGRGSGRYEWKNIFNQLGTDRYTLRSGLDEQTNHMQEAEYYYSSRTTYNTQFTGKYVWQTSRFDWNAGYAYANRNVPDRKRYTLNDQDKPDTLGLLAGNDINREYTRLDEHIVSGGVNYRYDLDWNKSSLQLFGGAYAEYRTRSYKTRSFIYNFPTQNSILPSNFRYLDLPTELFVDANYAENGLSLIDDTDMKNDYDGHHLISSAYVAGNYTVGIFNMLLGVRFEHSDLELVSNTRGTEKSPHSRHYKGDDFFPSLNATLHLTPTHQLRASYGRSVNRPEFREVSTSVFYDFELGSNVQGNVDLKSCYVNNVDLRWEWYPAQGDQISLAGFFKHFADPIEWIYTVSGGNSYVYKYENAKRATSLGLELDVRKNLGFIGLKDFTLVFNGSLIKSRVKFDKGSTQRNRPMQGQSPYLVNLGVFYAHKDWSASLLYNRIGKRLIGVGRFLGTTGDQTVNIPDSYEMPRNSLDISAAKTFGHFELKLGLKDILAEKVIFQQTNDVTLKDGTQKEVKEITRSYRPGRNFSLSVSYKF